MLSNPVLYNYNAVATPFNGLVTLYIALKKSSHSMEHSNFMSSEIKRKAEKQSLDVSKQ